MRRLCFCLACGCQFAAQSEIDVNLFGDFKKAPTGIFQSPLHIRHDEVRLGVESSSVDPDLHRHTQIMGRAMKCEAARNLDGGVARGRNGAVVFCGTKVISE